jgi:enoyl-CoA hydratase/carnithine racemase
MIFSGRQVDAEEALRIGLVDRVVPAAEFEYAAMAWASDLAQGPGAVVGLAKRAIDEGLDGELASGLRLEQRLFAESFRTEDSQIGVASFREHGPGKATFTGR